MIAVLIASAPVDADTLKLWAGAGEVVPFGSQASGRLPPAARRCEPRVADELRTLVAKAPLLTVNESSTGEAYVALITAALDGSFVAERAGVTMSNVRWADGTRRTYAFWDEVFVSDDGADWRRVGPTSPELETAREVKISTLSIAVEQCGKKRRAIAVTIAKHAGRKIASKACYERWVGYAEVQ